jgi:hypothetical protein
MPRVEMQRVAVGHEGNLLAESQRESPLYTLAGRIIPTKPYRRPPSQPVSLTHPSAAPNLGQGRTACRRRTAALWARAEPITPLHFSAAAAA